MQFLAKKASEREKKQMPEKRGEAGKDGTGDHTHFIRRVCLRGSPGDSFRGERTLPQGEEKRGPG